MISGTDWEGKFDLNQAWRTARLRHPEMLMPTQAIKNDDRRQEWCTHGNIIDWMEMAKNELVALGMLVDKTGTICEWLIMC